MGELSIEEKAKAYDEAIERARKINSGEGVAAPPDWTTCEVIFPELKESEDERIIRTLKEIVNWGCAKNISVNNNVELKDCLAWLEKQGSQNLANSAKTCKDEQNPAWSEEDEERLNSIIESYKDLLRDYKACHDVDYIPYDSCTVVRTVVNDVNYLKSLKERVQPQPKQEWSKEDEEIYRKCICSMRAHACGFPEEEKFVEQIDNWFKSLKERYTWKPSDEQMKALRNVIEATDASVLDAVH